MSNGLEMHEACSVGDRDSLEEFIKSGKYDVNMPDPEWQNRTPLHWACAKGYVECMRILLDNGANGTARMDMGWTPAHLAAESGKLNILRALHSAGVSLLKKDKYGDTPRRLAEVYGHEECIRYLDQVERERRDNKLNTDQSTGDSENDGHNYVNEDDEDGDDDEASS